MKLAEALQERADLNRNIEQLKSRLNNNLLVQEGEKPSEDPEKLKKELDASYKRIAWLIAHINAANCQTQIDGKTLTELIAKRDALSQKIGAYKDTVNSASQTVYRARGSEIKILSTIDVAAWQSEIDKMSKELRQLDNKLQGINWQTDLAE